MPKLRLNLDTLEVQSFDTAGRETKARGTVRARSETYEPTCTSIYVCTGEPNTEYPVTCQESRYVVCPDQPPSRITDYPCD